MSHSNFNCRLALMEHTDLWWMQVPSTTASQKYIISRNNCFSGIKKQTYQPPPEQQVSTRYPSYSTATRLCALPSTHPYPFFRAYAMSPGCAQLPSLRATPHTDTPVPNATTLTCQTFTQLQGRRWQDGWQGLQPSDKAYGKLTPSTPSQLPMLTVSTSRSLSVACSFPSLLQTI